MSSHDTTSMTTMTTGSLAKVLSAELRGKAELPIRWLSTIKQAAPDELTFARDPAHARELAHTKAAAAIVSKAALSKAPSNLTLLIVDDADLALITVLEMLASSQRPDTPQHGVHPTAVIDPTATLEQGVAIGAQCVIGPGVTIGQGTALVSCVTVGRNARIGKGCHIRAGVVIEERCSIGDGCIIHPNVVIGADGFGYRPAPGGQGLIKIPHIGAVHIGNGVEIGANSTIDRGKFGDTIIGDGTKIDNLVQIGHNCIVGRCCVLCGQSGLGGSVTLGDGAMLGGQAGVKDNISIGKGARLAGQSGTLRDVPDGESWMGYPALPGRQFMRQRSLAGRAELMFDELFSRVEALETEQRP